MSESYYIKTRVSNIATILSLSARKRMVNLFLDIFHPSEKTTTLDVGVTSESHPTANFLEKFYPFPQKLTCTGIQNATWLTHEYPGIKFVQLETGQPLPFKNQEFDFCYSNAVIEHVGSRNEQKAFLYEIMRVSKFFYITTPNRWFPVEMHTHVPLLHYLPQKLFRFLLKLNGENLYSQEKNLNLLSARDLRNLFPKDTSLTFKYIWTCGFPSNIVVYGASITDHLPS